MTGIRGWGGERARTRILPTPGDPDGFGYFLVDGLAMKPATRAAVILGFLSATAPAAIIAAAAMIGFSRPRAMALATRSSEPACFFSFGGLAATKADRAPSSMSSTQTPATPAAARAG